MECFMADLEGVALSDYLLMECISKGGVADVYRGRKGGEDGYDVAVKVFRPSYAQRESFRDYFMGEAEKIGHFDHTNILPFLEYGEGDDLLYLVMPFVTTGTLNDLLERVGGHLPALQALPVLQQLCSAIQYAHEHMVTHGNIKPSNIFLANDGRVLLSDFGIARGYDDSQQSLTRVGWGSAEYAAPEQSLGVLRQSSDIYSLGVLLFRILTGRPPFTGQTPVEVLLKHVRQQPPAAREIVPSISEAVDSVLRIALQKRSEDRFASVQELSNAFFMAVTVAPVALPISQSTGFMQPLFASSSALTQPRTPLPAVNPRAFVIDPQTPMPAFIALAPTSVSDAPSTFSADEERPSEQRAELLLAPEEAGDADKTEVYQKSVLAGEDEKKSISQAWLVEPPEWSPLAIASPVGAPGAVPLTADAYLRTTPLAADALPESVATLENVSGAEQKANVTKHTWLTILVVAFLLLGLLGALLSTFFFPS
jgi:serine/threonine protein kinase